MSREIPAFIILDINLILTFYFLRPSIDFYEIILSKSRYK